MSEKERPIHDVHPNGQGHPFKFLSLCGKLIRFGGITTEDRPVTCKKCLKTQEKICPMCAGTGMKVEGK